LLPWDTEQIGLNAARLDYLVAIGTYEEQYGVKSVLLSAVVRHCERRNLQHLSVRLDASDLSGLHVLESAGFITMDGILTFALEVPDLLPYEPDEGPRIRLAGPADSAEAAAVASEAYVHDRFHADPGIPKERADALHAVWLRNSCLGKAADAVVVAEDEQGLLGFVTCRLQRDTEPHLGSLAGTIVLVATAGRARRKGVAQAATRAALDWFRDQGAEVVEVGTQLRNIPAARLYQSLGFRLIGSGISLRKML
jgi:ribosomal protein S18 acetylase RimI-like enzyme